jgi:ClpP class serine protease
LAGATALELGLVDELGGLDVALGAVRRLLQLPPDAALDVQVRPEEEYPARRLLGLLRSRVGSLGALLGAIWPAAGTALSLAVAIR